METEDDPGPHSLSLFYMYILPQDSTVCPPPLVNYQMRAHVYLSDEAYCR